MTTEFLLIRHGQTDWNLTHRIQGSVDIPLNEVGVAQANATREALRGHHFDAVVSSHLERAVFTANTINAPHRTPQFTDARLAERAHGDYEGWTVKEIIAEIGEGNEDEFFQHSPALEAWTAVTERVLASLHEIATTHPEQTVVVVAHGGSIKAAVAAMQSVHHRSIPGLHNCSITRVRYDDAWSVIEYDNYAHLPVELRT